MTKDSPGQSEPLAVVKTSIDDFFVSFHADHPTRAHALGSVKAWVRGVVEGRAPGLVLWSENYGVGKTHLARCAAAALTYDSRVGPATILEEADTFFSALKESYEEHPEPGRRSEAFLFREWASGPVILDDVGKEYLATPAWAESKFFKLFNAVCGNHGILITANLGPVQLARRLGGAAVSRLSMVCDPEREFINMSGLPDYRPLIRKASQ